MLASVAIVVPSVRPGKPSQHQASVMETYLTLPSPLPCSLALPAPSSMNMRQASGAEGTCVVHRSTPGGRTLNSMLLQCDTRAWKEGGSGTEE